MSHDEEEDNENVKKYVKHAFENNPAFFQKKTKERDSDDKDDE